VISKETAKHYVWGSQCDGWHLVHRDDLSIIHERMPPGTSEVRHFHHYAHQFFFVLRGTATLEIDGKREILQAQQGLEVPRNCLHQMLNESDHELEFLVISHPPSHGDRSEFR
jgi:mannose-6-phosphate isomerase-like protein (cupin superfamily)